MNQVNNNSIAKVANPPNDSTANSLGKLAQTGLDALASVQSNLSPSQQNQTPSLGLAQATSAATANLI
ncbi:MAG: hypothetical protein RLZZ361_1563 [Cyanobacteriota bacterium]|jgi:hypothetical protein